MKLSGEAKLGLAFAVVLAVMTASSAPWWWHLIHSSPAQAASPVVGMSGGCESYQIFAQNRWAPYGTAVRVQPNVLSDQNGSYPGNMTISVNGWVHGRAAYTTNTAPWNSDVWFHLSDGSGWVSFPGVRATPINQDPTGLGDGGTSAPTPPDCEGAVQ